MPITVDMPAVVAQASTELEREENSRAARAQMLADEAYREEQRRLLGYMVFAAGADYVSRPAAGQEGNPIARKLFDRPLVLLAAKTGAGVVLPEAAARLLESGLLFGKRYTREARFVRQVAVTASATGAASNIAGKVW